jgi:hypothetical protein
LSKGCQVVCKYLIKHAGTAIAIKDMSEYPLENEILILPYALFKVKRIRKNSMGKGGDITEIDVEEDKQVKWTLQKPYQSSQTHTSVKKKTTKNEEEIFDRHDLAKRRKEEFGIDSAMDTFAKMRNDAMKGIGSRNDLAKSKIGRRIVIESHSYDRAHMKIDDEENDSNSLTASNEQSYRTPI